MHRIHYQRSSSPRNCKTIDNKMGNIMFAPPPPHFTMPSVDKTTCYQCIYSVILVVNGGVNHDIVIKRLRLLGSIQPDS